MLVIFSLKNVKQVPNLELTYLICACWIMHRYQTPLTDINTKGGHKSFNITEVWNPVCCHSNKTVTLVLWSIFIESYGKESNDSDSNWLRLGLFAYFKTLNIFGQEILNIANGIFLLIQASYLSCKMV